MQSGSRMQDVSRSTWRVLASTRLGLWLLAGLGLLMLAGTLLPQPPSGLDVSARAAWFGLAQHRYGSAYVPLRSLGLFEIYQSPAFKALTAALFVNTALCTINRLRSLLRMASKRRAPALGTLITHVAVMSLLLSLTVSAAYSWQEDAVALGAGQTHPLGYGGGLLLRSDDFRIELDAQGRPLDYVAQVTVLSGSQEIRTSRVRPNAPLRAAGVGVWLVSYEPGVRAEVHDLQGQALELETSSGEHTSGAATLSLTSGPALLRVPSAELELHVSGVADGGSGKAFYLQVQRSGTTTLLLSDTVPAGKEIRVAEVRVTLHADQHAIYRLKRDPGAAPALISALALVLGTSLSLFSSRERSR